MPCVLDEFENIWKTLKQGLETTQIHNLISIVENKRMEWSADQDNETFKQVFSAYIGSPLPVFVTSDSVLNAYHVLLEESIRRMETARARDLKK